MNQRDAHKCKNPKCGHNKNDHIQREKLNYDTNITAKWRDRCDWSDCDCEMFEP